MKDFSYTSPQTLQEALSVLDKLGSRARIAAGCTNILPSLRAGKVDGCVLVNLSLPELKIVEAVGDRIRLGSLTTINELHHSDQIKAAAPVLVEAANQFADPLVRNRATVGGNIANASPAADAVVPLLALDAQVRVISLAGGERDVPLVNFFIGPGKTVLRPQELIESISIARTEDWRSCFIKFGLRKAMAVSLASIAVIIKMKGNVVQDIRIALGALASTPIRATQTEEYLRGRSLQAEILAQAVTVLSGEVDPITDVRASRGYRLHLAGVLLKRAIEEALE